MGGSALGRSKPWDDQSLGTIRRDASASRPPRIGGGDQLPSLEHALATVGIRHGEAVPARAMDDGELALRKTLFLEGPVDLGHVGTDDRDEFGVVVGVLNVHGEPRCLLSVNI
ncbi:hypothetical protein CHELA40_50627 [Chelatococcus asaccharovorans]|nr:hypothetical protein CHELA17_20594 [Chelatococcus asaccharovorans]CAH1693642.1 hypothetical protein CHELA40_50627 [Chelatococcus asaccharovorans]